MKVRGYVGRWCWFNVVVLTRVQYRWHRLQTVREALSMAVCVVNGFLGT